MLHPLVDILFFNVYGALVTGPGFLLAVPYAIWQGARWLGSRSRDRKRNT